MRVITDYEELVGKTIAFAHMAQFADQITIATTDGCVLMAEMNNRDEWSSDKEILVFPEQMVINRLRFEPYLRQKLGELGIFDLEKYEEERRKEQEELARRRKEEKERKERELYEKLKKKYEGK